MKKAEIVADQIEQTIVGQRWEPGDLFGSEVELIARYGVSRAVFREAVRLLEHHGLAEMRRGLHVGGFVRQPDPKPVAKAMAEAARIASSGTQNLYDYHVLVARLTANPALHLFVRTLTDLTRRQQPVLDRNRLSPDIHAAHATRSPPNPS